MKNLLLAVMVVFTFNTLPAQFLQINEPAELAGVYLITPGDFGASLTTDIYCGDLVLATPNLACDPLTNVDEVRDKIVLIDRGTCQFGLKCLNAQNAGAKAVIIFNHTANAGTFRMAAGDFGGSVTIPCAMMSFEDGVKIKAVVGAKRVTGCMGNIKFDNDIGTNNTTSLIHAPLGCIPQSQIKNRGDFVFLPGAIAKNNGRNLAKNIKLNGVITAFPLSGTGSFELYNQTSTDLFDLEPDSSGGTVLPEFDLADQGVGRYVTTYTFSMDANDDAGFDNIGRSEFYLTSDIYCKGRWNLATQAPVTTISYRPAAGGAFEFLAGYRIPYGKGGSIDSLIVNVAGNAPLGGELIEAYLYGWQDADANGEISNDEISYLATAAHEFPASETRTSVMVRLWFEDFAEPGKSYVIPDDDMYFFTGVRYNGSNAVFFGFDQGMDYTLLMDFLSNEGVLTDFDLPYIGINSWDPISAVPDFTGAFLFSGVRAATAQALRVSGPAFQPNKFVASNDREFNPKSFDGSVSVFPTAASDFVNVDVMLKEKSNLLVYTVMDAQSRVIFQKADKSGASEYKARFNVRDLPAGQYWLHVRTDNGQKAVSFQVAK